MINITCSCGFTDDLIVFTRTAVFGDFPPGQFQCPACKVAWRRKESEHRLLTAGSESIVIPGRVEILANEVRL